MDEREMIVRRLAQAEEHVLLGEKNIARQKEIMAELERDGSPLPLRGPKSRRIFEGEAESRRNKTNFGTNGPASP
ncbi:hypothetical protein [Nitrobacter vulgaris]|uniref:Uncharacterized protein n=1 Tax=Nitrobacter vulgaris TaxID=29421 RepID=A0A1V4I161_NITVU|nr:hypothetical protein [Nitrobacter vulgaris]OPH83874.1 hypothetical protein B2M20_04690 [Nitrobacter vulgaris]